MDAVTVENEKIVVLVVAVVAVAITGTMQSSNELALAKMI